MSTTHLILIQSIQFKKLPPMEPKASEWILLASTQTVGLPRATMLLSSSRKLNTLQRKMSALTSINLLTPTHTEKKRTQSISNFICKHLGHLGAVENKEFRDIVET